MEKNKPIVVEYEDKSAKLCELYPYIVSWGKLMRSFGYYIELEVSKALRQNAPKDAIYYNDKENKWEVYSQCRPELQKELDEYLKGNKGGIIPHWYDEESTPENLKLILYGNSNSTVYNTP